MRHNHGVLAGRGRRSRRWLGVFLVLFLSAAACGLPVGRGANTPTPMLPGDPGQPTLAVPAATATSPGRVAEVLIYMVALEDAGQSGPQIGCGDSLVAVRRSVEPTNAPITAALEILLSIKTEFYGESGLYNALYQSNLSIERAEVDANGAATVALVGQYALGGACDTPRFKAQIEQTILSAGAQSASILLNGVPIDQALSEQ